MDETSVQHLLWKACLKEDQPSLISDSRVIACADGITRLADLQDVVAELVTHALPGLMSLQLQIDTFDKSRYVVKISGRHIGYSLPDPSYYAANVVNGSLPEVCF